MNDAWCATRPRALLSALLLTACVGQGAGATDGGTDTATDTEVDTGGPVEHVDDSAWPLDPPAEPPAGLAVDQVPQFVALGFDDNGYSGLPGSGNGGGMSWIVEFLADRTNPDGTPARVSFYCATSYVAAVDYESPTYVKRAWRAALEDGHEIGNHTHAHAHGAAFTVDEWAAAIDECTDWLTRPFDPDEAIDDPDPGAGIGVDPTAIRGFRTPFLEYNDATFSAVADAALDYDCSIEEGWHWEQNGTNYYWPYDLADGSPGNEILVEWGLKETIGAHPGVWELPVHPVVTPPDYRCAEYGLEVGFRSRLRALVDWFDAAEGKITGFDYNMWVDFRLTAAEALATLKYTLDLRLKGNRAPMLLGGHTDLYSDASSTPGATPAERREVIEQFLDYALAQPMVRVVPLADVLAWVEDPTPLAD